jgi:hypothetical protein
LNFTFSGYKKERKKSLRSQLIEEKCDGERKLEQKDERVLTLLFINFTKHMTICTGGWALPNRKRGSQV